MAAAAGTAFAIRPDQSPTPLPADTPSVTATPTPTQSPTPTPSTSAGDTPGAPPSGGTGTNTPTVKFGKLFYGPASVTDEEMVNLRSWRPGDSPVRLLALPELAAKGNASISPDGRRVAWVESDDSESTLVVADADGTDRQEMRSDVASDCSPVWSPDGRHLLFMDAMGMGESVRRGVLDTRSDKRTVTWWPGQVRGCHALWSADGRTIAVAVDLGVTLYAPDGTKKRVVPGFSMNSWLSHDIASLSSDGSRIALLRRKPGEESGDIARELWANAVLDTRSGKQVTLPLGGRTLRQVYFQSDGSMVVRVQAGSGYAVLLVDEDGRKISETAEPASLKNEQILAVVD
ncbi:PD40 domain-containing protein [Micromonospora sp. STR1s_5]|nr:PD40 domain-containing protein [Micromonospora sp. STR1s_5]